MIQLNFDSCNLYVNENYMSSLPKNEIIYKKIKNFIYIDIKKSENILDLLKTFGIDFIDNIFFENNDINSFIIAANYSNIDYLINQNLLMYNEMKKNLIIEEYI